MSLHRYDAPPPLAIALHPAPPRPTPPPKDPKEAKETVKAKDHAKDDKADAKGAAPLPVAKKLAEGEMALEKGKAIGGDAGKKGDAQPAAALLAPATPATETSMIPEPPTSARSGDKKKDEDTPKADDAKPIEEKDKAAEPAEDDKANETAGVRNEDKVNEKPKVEEPPEEVEPQPIRLISPPPHKPLQTKLDLHPTNPYPRVVTDPRGAYNKYARSMYMEQIYIDVTKDGWLFDQWKGKPEREALGRLNGDAERQMKREMEEAKRVSGGRNVPESAEAILLDLWNDLVLAPDNEVSSRICQDFRKRDC